MNEIDPTLRHLILCEDVQVDPENPRRITLVGLFGAIRALGPTPYPLLQRELCVFLQMTECRGPAEGRVELQNADSGEVIFRTRTRTLPLGNDPLEVVGVTFRIRNAIFPTPGLYWVQFWYNGRILGQQSLQLR
jgi:hypothetical protein